MDGPLVFAVGFIFLWFVLPRASVEVRRALVVAVVAAGLAIAVSGLIGQVVYRPRPFIALPHVVHALVTHSADSSFPSDHAAFVFALAAVVLKRSRWLGVASFVLAVGVALARVYVGVHWPSDVVSGAVLGWLVGLAIWRLRGPLVKLADWGMRATHRDAESVRGQGAA